MITVSQDVDSHLYYEVDWSDWLTSRGYNVSDIQGFTWHVPADTVNVTYTSRDGAKSRAWIKDAIRGEKTKVTCRIAMPAPDPSAPEVTDDYSFYLFGGTS